MKVPITRAARPATAGGALPTLAPGARGALPAEAKIRAAANGTAALAQSLT